MKDKCGKEIFVGSYIVYGHNLGRCAGLKFGKIIKIEKPKSEFSDHDYNICVIGIDDDWGFRDASLSKRGILFYPERIIVLDFNDLPEYAQKLLVNIKG